VVVLRYADIWRGEEYGEGRGIAKGGVWGREMEMLILFYLGE